MGCEFDSGIGDRAEEAAVIELIEKGENGDRYKKLINTQGSLIKNPIRNLVELADIHRKLKEIAIEVQE